MYNNRQIPAVGKLNLDMIIHTQINDKLIGNGGNSIG